MIRHPQPSQLATYLHRLATTLDTSGDTAITRARSLAERGYPAGTLGSGSRSSDTTSSTERAALNPNPWAGVDDDLARALRRLWADATIVEGLVDRILAHASDDDPIPAGRGHCQACEAFCKGDGENDRLRSGFCHACSMAWARWRGRRPYGARSDFTRQRRLSLGMPEAVGA